ncbi:VanZ family protein [Dyadobacter sp. 32]|uniref:VanZ family protein n=1 Tax=Dyadobacter sp. 32 TaxID=538966 RepID=UPI0011EFC3C0
MTGPSVISKYILVILLFLVIFSVFYFSWVPDPNIGSMKIFPTRIGHLINDYINLRTAIPFILLGAILESGLTTINGVYKKRSLIILSLAVIVTVAEVGQLFLPYRHFDWMDMFWGIAGSVAGMFLAWTCKWLLS